MTAPSAPAVAAIDATADLGQARRPVRMLLRSTTSPFDVLTPTQVLRRGTLANNAGNMLFLHAAYRILDTPDVTIDVDRFRVRPEDADRINDTYDVYVVPFANALRVPFESTLLRWAELVERLRIPVVVLGVGAQSSLEYDLARVAPIDATVRRFVAAVLQRAPSIGVRGEFTARYLEHLGFRGDEVDIIGCPSLFVHGPDLRVEKRLDGLTSDARLAFTTSPAQPVTAPILMRHHARYPNMVYVAQDPPTMASLVHFEGDVPGPRPPEFPYDPTHPLVREGKVRIFASPWPWMEFMRTRDFNFGTRIHGNLAGIMAGTPSYVLAFDSRTLELARYFEIPHRRLDDALEVDAAELYAEADYGRLNAGHEERWNRFAGFLHRHGLRHVFEDGGAAAFDTRMASIDFPAPWAWVPASGDVGEAHRGRKQGRRGRLHRRVHRVRGALARVREMAAGRRRT